MRCSISSTRGRKNLVFAARAARLAGPFLDCAETRFHHWRIMGTLPCAGLGCGFLPIEYQGFQSLRIDLATVVLDRFGALCNLATVPRTFRALTSFVVLLWMRIRR
jgi:hypothetical protein